VGWLGGVTFGGSGCAGGVEGGGGEGCGVLVVGCAGVVVVSTRGAWGCG
jgi:hypothetical protein